MSSSGLIYAVIVGAWAVYLVPTWLRREEELNAARQTARFAGAIKVLAHRGALERRVFARLDGTTGMPVDTTDVGEDSTEESTTATTPAPPAPSAPARDRTPRETARQRAAGLRRGKLLMRRRRTVAMLLVAALGGAIATAVLGVAYVGLTGVPGLLFVGYSVHVRRDERRRLAERERRRRERLHAERDRRRQSDRPAQQTPRPTASDVPQQPAQTTRRQRLIA
jgi:hypothetical protein